MIPEKEKINKRMAMMLLMGDGSVCPLKER
jgi:hypothetical protein